MAGFFSVGSNWVLDRDLHYKYSGRSKPSGLKAVAALLNPSLMAAMLFRLSATSSGPSHVFLRWLTLSLFASDVSTGAVFMGAVEFPHPTGIVIGRGAIIGANTRIFQNVTVGSSRRGEYPIIGNDVILYSGSVVAGNLTVGDNAIVGANCVVSRSVSASDVVRLT
jgi:serine O-acetyltransferase